MFDPAEWIDPSELPDFGSAVVRSGEREFLVAYLDLSVFPTVEELQLQLSQMKSSRPKRDPRRYITEWVKRNARGA